MKAVIIGAGPVGLTAAYEILKHSGIQPIVVEESEEVSGLSKTLVQHAEVQVVSDKDWQIINTVERIAMCIQEKYPNIITLVRRFGDDNDEPANIIQINWEVVE